MTSGSKFNFMFGSELMQLYSLTMVFSYLLLKRKNLNFRFMHMLLASAETQPGHKVREVSCRGGEQTVKVERKKKQLGSQHSIFPVLHM